MNGRMHNYFYKYGDKDELFENDIILFLDWNTAGRGNGQ